MLKYVYLYVTSVPEGGMNLRSMDIYEQHDKHSIKFHSHWTEPKLGATVRVYYPYVWFS
jgi:hypothetical protein